MENIIFSLKVSLLMVTGLGIGSLIAYFLLNLIDKEI